MFLLRLSLSFLLVVLGLGYIFDPKSIVRMNGLLREYFFKDSQVLLNGRRIGSLLIFIGFLLLVITYMTYR